LFRSTANFRFGRCSAVVAAFSAVPVSAASAATPGDGAVVLSSLAIAFSFFVLRFLWGSKGEFLIEFSLELLEYRACIDDTAARVLVQQPADHRLLPRPVHQILGDAQRRLSHGVLPGAHFLSHILRIQ